MIPIKQQLLQQLGIKSSAAGELLREAADLIPLATFVRNKGKNKPPEPMPSCVAIVKADVEQYQDLSAMADIPEERQVEEVVEPRLAGAPDLHVPVAFVRHDGQPKKGPKPLTEEEIEAKEEAKESKADKNRFQLIQTSSRHGIKHGIWDSREGATIFMAYTLAECQEEMTRLRSGKAICEWPIQRKHSRAEFQDN